MGNFFNKTKNLGNKDITEILYLKPSQLALLSQSELEIVSTDTLEKNYLIKGNNFKNIFQLKNKNLILLSEEKIDIISLKEKGKYNVEQTILLKTSKSFESNNKLYFLQNWPLSINIYEDSNKIYEQKNKILI